ncbi:Abhydrolase-4 domain-containing protein [Mycena kentingensis (nom. inval.)]|nr:Abhydrolase-4 domain-containing protein [Mycena kentingensis (nom. inval.)]
MHLTRFGLSSLATAVVFIQGVAADNDTFDWTSQLTPADKLEWVPCYANKTCARLNVPLDYTNADGAKAVIAMVRINATVGHDSPSYRGPVLLNPGGPGGSGVDLALGLGEDLQAVIGPEFDVIGFDPRGIARSTPRATFFTCSAERDTFLAAYAGLTANASSDALARIWARGSLLGGLAGERDDGSLRFMNTQNTARDMLRIVQAHGRDKLQYWGFS